jgi:methylenetetrahydrofolate reductase (NADPH)
MSPFRVIQNGEWREDLSRLFRDLRQPEWWNGDSEYHSSKSSDPVSKLHAALRNGEFVITSEVVPPAGLNTTAFAGRVKRFENYVHAINVATNPMATARMSSLACSLLLKDMGIEPILQVAARDHNRLNLQSSIIGASALSIRNVLCLTGDTPTAGKAPFQGLPFDLDATQLLWILRKLRDNARFLDGRELDDPPALFLGAAGSPNDPDPTYEAIRIEKKINAGAQFLQTQLVYDIARLEQWLEALDARNLLSKVFILVGIAPLRSFEHALFLQKKIPDVTIPANFTNRLVQSISPEETGLEIARELIEQIKELPGVSGVHLMSVGGKLSLSQLIEKAHFNPKRLHKNTALNKV